MKKTLIGLGIIASMLIFTNGQAANVAIAQNGDGLVTIQIVDADGPDVEFNPSNNVIMSGGSSATAFVVSGYHTQVQDRTSGKQFAMASDENAVFWRDISDEDTAVDPVEWDANNTNVTAFDGNWTTM